MISCSVLDMAQLHAMMTINAGGHPNEKQGTQGRHLQQFCSQAAAPFVCINWHADEGS